MLKKRILPLILLFILCAFAGGCQIKAGQTASSQADADQTDANAQMIRINGDCLISTGREAVMPPSIPEDSSSITCLVPPGTVPTQDGEANFDCLGAACVSLSDGAAAVELHGTWILFLDSDTVEYEGIYKKKKDLSEKTLTWLNFYYTLSEEERRALSMVPSEFVGQLPLPSTAQETSTQAVSYIQALTPEELAQTEELAQSYFTNETPYYEGVDQIYPVDGDSGLYQNAGLESEYAPGNIIIYKVLTVRDRRDGSPFRTISIARSGKSSSWKIINSGY